MTVNKDQNKDFKMLEEIESDSDSDEEIDKYGQIIKYHKLKIDFDDYKD